MNHEYESYSMNIFNAKSQPNEKGSASEFSNIIMMSQGPSFSHCCNCGDRHPALFLKQSATDMDLVAVHCISNAGDYKIEDSDTGLMNRLGFDEWHTYEFR